MSVACENIKVEDGMQEKELRMILEISGK